VVALEPVARDFARVAASSEARLSLSCSPHDWRRGVLCQGLGSLDTQTERGRALHNVVVALVEADTSFELAGVAAAYDRMAAALAAGGGAA
jgi:hypothetical protein